MNWNRVWNSKNLSIVFFAYVLISLVAAVQGLFGTPKVYVPGGIAYPDYNNYLIFKYSFYHLISGKDLYQLFPADQYDLYKYSPSFAVLFGSLAWLPDPLGLVLWNLINSLCLFAAVRMLPGMDDKKKSWILLFCLLELLVSIQNAQSNGLMAGLIILAFALAERSKYFLSTLCIVLSIYIKIFGALAFVLYLFYPGKLKTAAYSIFWMLIMAILPLALIGPQQLIFLYKSWLHLLQDDHSASTGISLMGILQSWSGSPSESDGAKNGLVLAGLLLFLLPLLRIRHYKDYTFRLLMLASVLLWIVIFNHKAESPTFIIAMSGIGIWYFAQERSRLNTALLILVLFLVSLSISDLVPSFIRNGWVRPYRIKALMPILIWGKLVYELLFLRYRPLPTDEQRLSTVETGLSR
ncbi:MAG TPA: glycosyltransferase family 87 protein [Puia sp.]|nr:glycosyltransferase family 87 protein [Puia sp.]